MGTYIVSHHIEAPADQVWAAITDFEHAAERISGITKMEMFTDGPPGVGTRWRETRIMFKKQATEEMEITEWDPPRQYVVEAESCGCHYRTIMAVRPSGDGCEVEMAMHTTPVRFMAKLMMPLMGWMMAGACKKCILQDLKDIEVSLQGPAAQPA